MAALEERTEGWIAGLQLATFSMQGHDDTAGFIRAFRSSDPMNQTKSLFVRTFPLSLFTLLILAIAWPAPAARSQTSPDFTAVDAYVEAEMKKLRIPGLALAVVQGDQIMHLQGFGVADPLGRPVTAGTPFIIGSTSKSFTALAIMQLVETGQVELDAPVQRYLPWFRVADPEASAAITVRQLLIQTSGLSRAAGLAQPASDDTNESALEERVRALNNAELTQPVGAAHQYSNANYDVLGLIVQAASGQSYEAYVQQHIFAPLAMDNSFVSQTEAMQHGMAVGYRYWFGFPAAAELPYNRGSVPSGYVISTAEDMAHYLIAHLNGGRYGQASLLSAVAVAEMHQPAVTTGIPDPFRTSYGMGWLVGETSGVLVIHHEGATSNFSAHMLLAPEERWGIVILANANNGFKQSQFQGMIQDILGLLVGQPPVIQTNPFERVLSIAFVVIVAIVILLLAGLVRSGTRLWRGQAMPAQRLHGWPAVALPSILLLLVAWFFLSGMPQFFGTPLRGILLTAPDFGYVLLAGGLAALGWSMIRMVEAYFIRRRVGAGLS